MKEKQYARTLFVPSTVINQIECDDTLEVDIETTLSKSNNKEYFIVKTAGCSSNF